MHQVSSKQVKHESMAGNGAVYGFPLSFAQQRIWFLDQLEPNKASYNIPWSIRIKGDLSVRALEATLQEIVRRHEVFRTTFQNQDGEPVQVISEFLEISLPVTDMAACVDAEKEALRTAALEAA